MKVLKGVYKQEDEEETETIEIGWDHLVDGSIEVVRIKTDDNALIRVPGELVYKFLEAFFHERKIDVLKIFPNGYRE